MGQRCWAPSPGDAHPSAAFSHPLFRGGCSNAFFAPPCILLEEASGFDGGDGFTTIIMQSLISLLLKPPPLLAAGSEPTAIQTSQVPIHLRWVPDNDHTTWKLFTYFFVPIRTVFCSAKQRNTSSTRSSTAIAALGSAGRKTSCNFTSM